MSVPKGDRREAGSQFCQTAKELHVETLKRTKKWDKSYTFTLKNPICECARNAHMYAIAANKVFVKTKGDFDYRRNCLQRAYSAVCQMDALLETAQDVIGFSPEKMAYWAGYIYDEKRLLKGVMESDFKRWGDMV